MNNIETIKQELLTQKGLIERKGGTVAVANLHPSPTEITQGIGTIQVPDFSEATAVAEDVVAGKTFYAGNSVLKTGTMQGSNIVDYLVMFDNEVPISADPFYYTIPDTTILRDYFCYHNPNNLNFTLPTTLQSIGKYAFYQNFDLHLTNFDELSNLQAINDYAFYQCRKGAIDFENLPTGLVDIYQNAFRDCFLEGSSIVMPNSIKTLGNYAFAASEYIELDQLHFTTGYTSTIIGQACLMFESFDCDFTPPTGRSYEIGTQFNYRGSFNNVTIPSNITRINNYAFGGATTDPVANFHMSSITFQNTLPPTINSQIVATQHFNNGCKIYVPDTAVDVYKAVSSFSYCKQYIYPVSQKP